SASKCQGKWPDQTLDQACGLPEVLVAVSTSRLSCKRAGKTRTLMTVWDSSGESRLMDTVGPLQHNRAPRHMPNPPALNRVRPGFWCRCEPVLALLFSRDRDRRLFHRGCFLCT